MIILLVGEKGSGKSTFIVIIVNNNLNIKYISNLTIYLPNIEKFTMDKLLNNSEIGKNFIIDEASLYLDKRRSMSDINVVFSWMEYQSRKFQSNIHFAIQDETILDERSIKSIDLYIYCYHIENYYIYIFKNKYRQITGNFVIPEENIKPFQKLFDTYEIISNEKVKEFQNKFLSIETSQDLVINNIDKIIKFAKEYNQKKITEQFIQFYLEHNKLPVNKSLKSTLLFEVNKRLGEMKHE